MTYYCIYEFDKGINGIGRASDIEFYENIKNKEIGVNQVILECSHEFYDYFQTHEFGYPDRQFTITNKGVLTFI